MSFLELTGITKRFGATLALDNVNLAVNSGEVHALVGENGSGKSTLMRILAGALRPDEGQLVLNGESYSPTSPLDARKKGVAMIHQELSICGDLSVTENVLLGMEEHKLGVLSRRKAESIARDALAQLGHADLDLDQPAKYYSLATRQLIEIARAIAVGCRVVILDEPTSSLTRADVENLFRVVEKLKASGHAIVYITHFLDEIHRIADRMTVLRDGKFIGERSMDGVTDQVIVSMMVGRDIEEVYVRSKRQTSDVILSCEEVIGNPKPAKVSFDLKKGQVLGIAGLNGSGRTELLRVIFGLDAVKSGKIRVGLFEGYDSPKNRWRQGVGLLSENRKEEGLAINLSIAENIVLSSLRPGLVLPKDATVSAKKWIERLAIKCQGPDQSVRALSGGNQQKVALARMLHHGVDVLLMDEPTRGIDVGSKEQIYRLIDELAIEGKAVLVVSSYLPELLGICDQICVMNRGELSVPLDARTSTQESIMQVAVG